MRSVDIIGWAGFASVLIAAITRASIDLSMHEQFEWVAPVITPHPTNVFGGIEPDLGSHQGQQGVWGRAEPNALTLQFGDVANTVPGE